jgi:hypothetical protein
MANDIDVKTSVDEETHDDLLVMARQYGFKTRSECVRWLIKRELAWAKPHLQIMRLPGVMPERKLD